MLKEEYDVLVCCRECRKELDKDEKAIYYRLVNRDAKDFLCIPCLSNKFKCKIEDINKRIVELKNMGCTLFD
jgi:biotin operon repressor